MKINEITDEDLHEAPRSRFKQAMKGLGSRALNLIPGGDARAANLAARADLDATVNNVYREFARFLGSRDKKISQASGKDLRDFLTTNRIEFSGKKNIPDDRFNKDAMNHWLFRVGREIVSKQLDTDVFGGGDVYADRTSTSASQDTASGVSDDLSDAGSTEFSDTEDEQHREIPRGLILSQADSDYLWNGHKWIDARLKRIAKKDVQQQLSSQADKIRSTSDLPKNAKFLHDDTVYSWNGVNWINTKRKHIAKKDVQKEINDIIDGKTIARSKPASVVKPVVKSGGDPFKGLVVSASDENDYVWRGANWVNLDNKRLAKKDIKKELEQNVPVIDGEIPDGLKVEYQDTVYRWNGRLWYNNSRKRFAKKEIAQRLTDYVLGQQSEDQSQSDEDDAIKDIPLGTVLTHDDKDYYWSGKAWLDFSGDRAGLDIQRLLVDKAPSRATSHDTLPDELTLRDSDGNLWTWQDMKWIDKDTGDEADLSKTRELTLKMIVPKKSK